MRDEVGTDGVINSRTLCTCIHHYNAMATLLGLTINHASPNWQIEHHLNVLLPGSQEQPQFMLPSNQSRLVLGDI